MMDDRFKYRGRRVDNGEWEIGSLILINPNIAQIVVLENFKIYVDIATVSQCTGLKDKNDRLIYEGDIVRREWVRDGMNRHEDYIIKFDLGMYIAQKPNSSASTSLGHYVTLTCGNHMEIIGNIYENPELMENVYCIDVGGD